MECHAGLCTPGRQASRRSPDRKGRSWNPRSRASTPLRGFQGSNNDAAGNSWRKYGEQGKARSGEGQFRARPREQPRTAEGVSKMSVSKIAAVRIFRELRSVWTWNRLAV